MEPSEYFLIGNSPIKNFEVFDALYVLINLKLFALSPHTLHGKMYGSL
ncbi:hypothetical protein MQW34_09700 [Bacillus sp. ZJS3]|nr:hypothetical protein MQW34_09700 [Bacillus sp. ZJS3]